MVRLPGSAWHNLFLGEPTSEPITALLQRVREGDEAASHELMPLVYGELQRIARKHLSKERVGHTLQATALVNEAYLRLFQGASPEFADRVHFLALASRVMRRILVDYARGRASARRGGGGGGVILPEANLESKPIAPTEELLDLDRAIEALALENSRVASVVEMHYFGGMTAEETAQATGRSIHMVNHDLRFAYAWLRRKLAADARDQAGQQQ